MALYYSTNGNIDKVVNVGETEKILAMNDVAESVTKVQANGDEAVAIERQFTNIPMCWNRVVTWYGDHAKFVAKHFS